MTAALAAGVTVGELQQVILQGQYPVIAITCLSFYEWMLTASMEVELIHGREWTSVKIMYLLCRYYPLLFWPIVSWAYVGIHDPDSCSYIVAPVQLLHAPMIIPQGVMMMRAYAFTGRNRKTLVGLSLAYIALIAVNFWAFTMARNLPSDSFYQMIGPTGCYPAYSGVVVYFVGCVMLAATLMDGASLAVILVHCYRTRYLEISLGRYFVMQGFYAFCSVLAVNVTVAVIFFVPNQLHTALGIPIFLVLCDLIACRLILQLRRKVSPTDSEISRRNSEVVRDALAAHSGCSNSPEDSWLLQKFA